MVARSRHGVAAVLNLGTQLSKRGGRLSACECLLTLVDLCHERRIGKDRKGMKPRSWSERAQSEKRSTWRCASWLRAIGVSACLICGDVSGGRAILTRAAVADRDRC